MDKEFKELEEKYSKNRPTFSLFELIKCAALIVAGCVVFVFIPDEMGILGWILFVVGTFLNIVGIFRLAATVPGVKNDATRKIASLIALVAAAIIQFIGLAYLYNSDGTGKGMAITTLTMCISLGLIIYVLDYEDAKLKKKIEIGCKVITFLLVAIAVFLVIRTDFSDASIAIGTILLIEAVVTSKIGFKW